ncbi:MAG: hypothetical protein V4467_00125 [Patescibacteria group bacterium]
MNEFIFWWSVVSTILSVILLCASVWQYSKAQNQEEKTKSQVKVWMQDASGLSQALSRIVSDNLSGRYHSTNDVCNAIWAVHASAFALYQSLYEERCVTEEEYKERQKAMMEKTEKSSDTTKTA